VQGNLDPITLFAPLPVLETRVKQVLEQAGGRPGHIFNLGHGIVPGTPVEHVQAVVKMVKQFAPKYLANSIPQNTTIRPGSSKPDSSKPDSIKPGSSKSGPGKPSTGEVSQ